MDDVRCTTPESNGAASPPEARAEDSDASASASSTSGSERESDDASELGGGGAEADDPDIAELLRINSESSSSGDEDYEDDEGKEPAKPPIKRDRHVKCERPISTVVVLVLACWTMRVPVVYADFARCVSKH